LKSFNRQWPKRHHAPAYRQAVHHHMGFIRQQPNQEQWLKGPQATPGAKRGKDESNEQTNKQTVGHVVMKPAKIPCQHADGCIYVWQQGEYAHSQWQRQATAPLRRVWTGRGGAANSVDGITGSQMRYWGWQDSTI